jgi:hypothetical protein
LHSWQASVIFGRTSVAATTERLSHHCFSVVHGKQTGQL